MSEEVKNASTDVPRSMLLSLVINGTLALGMLFAVLFSAHDITILLKDQEATTAPFLRIFTQAVGSEIGATIMVAIIVLLEFCSAMGCLAAASRMTWSFARDRGLPFSRALSMVSTPTHQETTQMHLLIPYADRQTQHHPRRLHPRRNRLRRPPRPHKHRQQRRLQRHNLPRPRRLLPLLSPRHRPAPLAPRPRRPR